MPKLVTVLKPEKIDEQARYYVRTHILLPAGTIGLVCMVGGVGALAYQLLANHTYSWVTFLSSSLLIVVGAGCGYGQARYHRYLFKTFPEVYAAKMRSWMAQRNKKTRGRQSLRRQRSNILAVALSRPSPLQERSWSLVHQPQPTCTAISTCFLLP